jgi:hypothetical protein
MDRASFGWRGGPLGYDRPLERAFVRIQRRNDGRWRTVDSDLGLQTLWKVDEQGSYEVLWEPTYRQRTGRHRFVITANGYRLASKAFAVRPATDLRERNGGRVVEYPAPVENVDLTWRPKQARARAGVDRYGNSSG